MDYALIVSLIAIGISLYAIGRNTGYRQGKADALWETLELQRKHERQSFQFKDIGCPPGHIPNLNAASIKERNDLISRNMFGKDGVA